MRLTWSIKNTASSVKPAKRNSNTKPGSRNEAHQKNRSFVENVANPSNMNKVKRIFNQFRHEIKNFPRPMMTKETFRLFCLQSPTIAKATQDYFSQK